MAVTTEAVVLGCGRTVHQVWDHIAEPPDAHEATCPYCRQARASLAELVRVTSQLRERTVVETDPVPSDRVKRSVMAIARAEVRRGRPIPLRAPVEDQLDDLTISEQVVAGVVRATADLLPGLRARRCAVRLATGDAPPPTGLRPASTVTVDLTLAVAHTVSIPLLLPELREAIARSVVRETGLRVAAVNVSVDDVFDA